MASKKGYKRTKRTVKRPTVVKNPRAHLKTQHGRPDLTGPTGSYLRGQGGGNTGQGMTENIDRYKSPATIRAQRRTHAEGAHDISGLRMIRSTRKRKGK